MMQSAKNRDGGNAAVELNHKQHSSNKRWLPLFMGPGWSFPNSKQTKTVSERRRLLGDDVNAESESLSCVLYQSKKNSSPPLVPETLLTAVHVRCRTRRLSVVRIDLARRTDDSGPVEFVGAGEFMRSNRRQNDGGGKSPLTASAPEAVEPKSVPFAQRLT